MVNELQKVKEALEYTINASPNFRIVAKCEKALVELNAYMEDKDHA